MNLQSLQVSVAVVAIGLILSYVLIAQFKMPASAVITNFAILLYLVLFIGNQFSISYLTAFLLLGLAKLVNRAKTAKSDLTQYKPRNFIYSGVLPVLFATLAIVYPLDVDWIFIALCGLSTVVADSTASEIGIAYGNRTFLITSLRPVQAGIDGGVSIVGTVAAVVSSLILATVASLPYESLAMIGSIMPIAVIGFLGHLLDSVLGATLQVRRILSNEAVNFVSIAGASVLAFAWLYSHGS